MDRLAGSAEDVSFDIEGGGEVPVLRARLRNSDGDMVDADVNLSERIENIDGQFTFGMLMGNGGWMDGWMVLTGCSVNGGSAWRWVLGFCRYTSEGNEWDFFKCWIQIVMWLWL